MRDATTPAAVTITVNGRPEVAAVPPRTTLADLLRHELGLTGTHLGCEHGVCGACTVLLDGAAVRSCLTLAVAADGRAVETVEGLTEDALETVAATGDPDATAVGPLHPLQEAFWSHQALQCGFCTPGFLMTAVAAVRDDPDLSREEIRTRIAGNVCRCTGYQPIVDAVTEYAAQVRSRRDEP